MKIVIDINDDTEELLNSEDITERLLAIDNLIRAFKDGTVLPKGHGKLVDLSYYENNYFNTRIQYDDGDRTRTISLIDIPAVVEPDYENNN